MKKKEKIIPLRPLRERGGRKKKKMGDWALKTDFAAHGVAVVRWRL